MMYNAAPLKSAYVAVVRVEALKYPVCCGTFKFAIPDFLKRKVCTDTAREVNPLMQQLVAELPVLFITHVKTNLDMSGEVSKFVPWSPKSRSFDAGMHLLSEKIQIYGDSLDKFPRFFLFF